MDKIVVSGGQPLTGRVHVSGAKNAVLPVMAATLLTGGRNVMRNVPSVRDVSTMTQLLAHLGAAVEWTDDRTLVIDTSRIHNHEAPYELVRTMRASCLVLGPLVARLGKARVSLPGGCAIGARPVDLHIKGLQALGAKLKIEKGYVFGNGNGLRGNVFYFDGATVTGTANIMMAAALAQGTTVLGNSAREPEVTFLAEVLNEAGARIEGLGTDTLTVHGVSSLRPIDCRIFPDRIETGTYMVAAAITGGDVEIHDCVPGHLDSLTVKLEQAGVDVETGEGCLRVRRRGPVAAVNLRTQPYPGFPTDMQAQFMALMTLARGQSIIQEAVFENRFMHAAELKRMGADIDLDGHSAIVHGVPHLSGAPLMATDLRASASLVLAALAARGESVISRVYHIDRGYESMEAKLSQLGADIRRVK